MSIQFISGLYLILSSSKGWYCAKAIMHARRFSINPSGVPSRGSNQFHASLLMHTKADDDGPALKIIMCACACLCFGASCIHFLWFRGLWWRFDWPLSGSSFLSWWWQMTHNWTLKQHTNTQETNTGNHIQSAQFRQLLLIIYSMY